MLKIALSAIIIASGSMLGIGLGHVLRERVRVLEELITSLLDLRSDVGFLHTPMPQIFARLAGRYGAVSFLYAQCLVDEGDKTADLSQVWEAAATDFVKKETQGAEVLEALIHLGGGLGKSDGETQLTRIDRTIVRLEACLLTAKEKSRRMGPVYNHAGTAASVLLVLLLI